MSIIHSQIVVPPSCVHYVCVCLFLCLCLCVCVCVCVCARIGILAKSCRGDVSWLVETPAPFGLETAKQKL